jgi:all-trans-retinol 13,14-reductase
MKRGDEYLALKEDIRQRLLEELFQHVPQLRSAGLDGSAHTAELRDIRQT